MEKRRIIFGDYNTGSNGWTLTGWQLSEPEQKTNYIEKAGGDGSHDLSTALSDGVPRYKDRSLTATFERSDGDRRSREREIRAIINALDGFKMNIELPDDDEHYITGRVHVARDYNDLAHAAITVTAVCEPWRYSNEETILTLPAITALKTANIVNEGRRAIVPTIKVAGEAVDDYAGRWQFSETMKQGSVLITQELKIYYGLVEWNPPYSDGGPADYDTATLTITPNGPITLLVHGRGAHQAYEFTLMTGKGERDFSCMEDRTLYFGTTDQGFSEAFKAWMNVNMTHLNSAYVTLEYKSDRVSLGPGTHKWPNLLLTPGEHPVNYYGTSTATLTYREAVLE